jgi:ATP synthase protein I
MGFPDFKFWPALPAYAKSPGAWLGILMVSGSDKDPKEKTGPTEFNMLLTASSIGLAVVVAIFLGLGLGLFLDKYFGTKPWLTIAGLVLGVVAGFRNLWVMSQKLIPKKRDPLKSKDENRDDDHGQ